MTLCCLYLQEVGGGDLKNPLEVDSAPISLLYQTTRSHNLRLCPHRALYGIQLLSLIATFSS